MQNKKNTRQLSDYTSLVWAIAIGVVCFAAHIFICKSIESVDPATTGLILLALYLVAATIISVSVYRYQVIKANAEEQLSENANALRDLMAQIDTPIILTGGNGKMVWYNSSAADVFRLGNEAIGTSMYSFCELTEDKLLAGSASDGGTDMVLYDNNYKVNCYRIHTQIKNRNDIRNLYLVYFEDVTALRTAESIINRTLPVVAYIMVDNLEELAQYIKVSYRQATGEIENILKEWASSFGGVLREYDRDRYLLLMTREMLDKCFEDKFSIIDRIHDVRLSDEDLSMPVTVSMGISAAPLDSRGFDLVTLEQSAAAALDVALQRGGDQIAVKTENGLDFFGGRTKSIQKRTKVRARVIAEKLCSLISASDCVLVMGHKSPDFDSIGACIGIARLASYLGVDCRIVVDGKNNNYKISTEALINSGHYDNIFIDSSRALELVSTKALMILVDANNFKIIEAPELANNISTIYIVDHHRQTDALPESVVTPPYIDPAASSACELVAEILEQCVPSGTLTKDEASIMLSGIMVDTENFTKSTSTRTFAAALYLRGEGANPEIAGNFFDEDIKDYIAESKFSNDVIIYKNRIAITKSNGTDASIDRVAASKAASKLQTVRGIDASFALVDIGNGVNISARSNGTINVQLVLEKLNGGGHFDAAGAQVGGASLQDAAELLKKAIDEYFEENDL